MNKTIATLLCLACGLALIGAVEFDMASKISPNYTISFEQEQKLMKLRSLGFDFANHFQNITMADLRLPSIPKPEDLQCLADLNLVMNGIVSGSFWARRMIDSWGSVPSGLLYLNLLDMGNYKECVRISEQITDKHTLKGKYCLSKLPISEQFGFKFALKIGLCFPASCTNAHRDTLLNTVIQKLLNTNSSKLLLKTDPQTCRTSDREPFDGLTIFAIVILSIFGGLAVLATLWDYFVCQDQKQLNPVVKIFSIRATSRALFRITENTSNPNVINCLHGMRCMSLVWVVFGHEFSFSTDLPNMNPISYTVWFDTPFSNLIKFAVFSVDTFFFLSGLLVIMVAMRVIEKSKGRINVPLMYIHRYLRLTPILALGILIYMKILPRMVDAPLAYQGFHGCQNTWFWTLLYIQNYATRQICLQHSWYLSVDMQLYIISPIFLFGLYKWGKKAAIGMLILMVLSSVWLFTLMMVTKYSMYGPTGTAESQHVVYFYTHLHAAPWLIGGVFGYFLHVNRGKSFKFNRLAVWGSWILCLGIMFTCLFSLLPYATLQGPKMSMLTDATYYTLTRVAWPVALCWVVFACVQGYGGMADSFLSHPIWQPLSRLSYSAYVFHLLVMEVNIRRSQANTYFSNYDIMLRFWSDLAFTVITAYAMYVTIEAPLGGLEAMLFSRKPTPKPIEATTSNPEPAPIESIEDINGKTLPSDLDLEATTSKPSSSE